MYKQVYVSPLGSLSLVASSAGLRGVWFEGQKHFERELSADCVEAPHPILEEAMRCLDAYFLGENVDFSSLPLDSVGTPFQRKVWHLLQEIPLGETRSYGELAACLGIASGQAVGGAVGKNPLSILVPCHRVVGSKGQLTGYAGGLERKRWLLDHERKIKRLSRDIIL